MKFSPAGRATQALALPRASRAERAVASALLAGTPFVEVSAIVSAGDFADVTCAIVFAAVARLQAAGIPVDLVTASAEIQRAGDLGAAGGAAEVAGLVEGLPDAVNAEAYARIVLDAAIRRQAIESGLRLSRDAADATVPVGATIASTAEALGQLASRLNGNAPPDANANLATLDKTALWRATRAAEEALVLLDLPAVRERVACCRAEVERRRGAR